MELREYWYVIRKRLLMVLFIPILTALVSGYYAVHKTPVYTISETLLMNETNLISGQPDTATDTGVLQSQFFANIINQNTNRLYSVKDLAKVSFSYNGSLVTVSLATPDMTYGTDLVNAISNAMKSGNVVPGFNGGRVIDPATSTPVSLHKKRTVILATVMALIAALGLAFLTEYLDLRIKSEQDLTRYLNIPSLGSVDDHKVGKKPRRAGRVSNV